ncbi:MAG: acyltransferase [Oscillospiraceae bacterium]|nr:acyltransferase [Oscillospiraceae bacterium]
MKKSRLFYLDLIRAVALCCILIVHFNATVTGYFTYPSKLFGSTLPFGIYLGDFGSSLFFMVSGAALAYTSKDPLDVPTFYRKRAKAVYPMFWLAWCIVFSVRFVTKPGYYAGAKTSSLLLTAVGLDNFAVAAGWVAQDFACVGEWFLGTILFLYLLFPLLKAGLKKSPLLTWCAVLAVSLPVHLMGWDARLVAIHLPEFLLGMAYISWSRRTKCSVLVGLAIFLAVPPIASFDSKITCAVFSAVTFILFAALGNRVHFAPLQNVCALLSKYSYAVFLIHHVIIQRLAENFDLSVLSRRDTAFLFGVYLLCVAGASAALYWIDGQVRKGFAHLLKSS